MGVADCSEVKFINQIIVVQLEQRLANKYFNEFFKCNLPFCEYSCNLIIANIKKSAIMEMALLESINVLLLHS